MENTTKKTHSGRASQKNFCALCLRNRPKQAVPLKKNFPVGRRRWLLIRSGHGRATKAFSRSAAYEIGPDGSARLIVAGRARFEAYNAGHRMMEAA